MLSVVAKNLSKSSMERNPNNKRGNTIEKKGGKVTQNEDEKKRLLRERFARIGGKK